LKNHAVRLGNKAKAAMTIPLVGQRRMVTAVLVGRNGSGNAFSDGRNFLTALCLVLSYQADREGEIRRAE